jgi:hypothetical protein
MQTLRPDSGLNYQSLDLPFDSCSENEPERIFRYEHIIHTNDSDLIIQKGDTVNSRFDWWSLTLGGARRNGFIEGFLSKIRKNVKYPLYKTEEKYFFHETN